MHQNTSSKDFEEFEAVPGRRRGGWLLRALFLAVALVVVAGAGYGLGRGTWAIPSSISDRMPAGLAGWLATSSAVPATDNTTAALKDYAFELVGQEAKQGDAILAVRLSHKSTGKPVPDAVVFASRLDMAPAGMPTMSTELEPLPATEPGLYRFKTNPTMVGDWQFSLAAKVPGETGTVQSQIVFKAVP